MRRSRSPGCPVSGLAIRRRRAPWARTRLTWKYFGDWRGMLQGPWAGSMQNMHPQLGAAVEEHSIFFQERWPRLLRSLYPIGGVVFDSDRAPRTGRRGARLPRRHQGCRRAGRRYHALNPDVFYWAHSTFFMGTIIVADRLCGGITEAREAPTVRRARPLVLDVRHEHAAGAEDLGGVPGLLEPHVHRGAGEQQGRSRRAGPARPAQAPVRDWMPDWMWSAQRKLLATFFVWFTVGLYDPPVRKLMGYSWSRRDEWLHRRFGDLVHLTFARCRSGPGCIRAPAPDGTGPPDGCPPIHRCRRPRHATSRRWNTAATGCTTAPWSEDRLAWTGGGP